LCDPLAISTRELISSVSKPPAVFGDQFLKGDGGRRRQAGDGVSGEMLVESFPGGTQDPLDAARGGWLDALERRS
jgi:hypothetical protein